MDTSGESFWPEEPAGWVLLALPMSSRQILLIVGAGRSGTSLMAGVMSAAGWHVPQPEIVSNDANLRGFGEPRWAVEFHSGLLRNCYVGTTDARPEAFAIAAKAASDPAVARRLRSWLEGQLNDSNRLVIKDPRTVWFLRLWQECANELDANISFLTMLRHPTEVVVSARRYYDKDRTDANLTASWVNVMQYAERTTRNSTRSFACYDAILADWLKEIQRIANDLGLHWLAELSSEQRDAIDSLIDPNLHRAPPGWDQLEVPSTLRLIAEKTWDHLVELTQSNAADTDCSARVAVTEAYEQLYAEAEAICESSIVATRLAFEGSSLRRRTASFARSSRRRLIG
jgi:hypothetical protein